MFFRARFSIDIQAFDEYYKKIPMFRIAKIMKSLANSVKLDGIEPDKLEEHDKLFEPKDENEKKLWLACREINKKDLIALRQKVEGGQKGGRPPMTAEEKKAKLEQAAKNIGAVGKNQVKITPDFKLPNNEYFNAYRKELPKETESVERWLKTAKLDSIVDYDWIGKQIQNFRKRKIGRIL